MGMQELEKNKKYKLVVFMGYDINGHMIRHIETFNGGKRDATIRFNELKAKVKNNTLTIKDTITLSELTEEYLKSKTELAPKTVQKIKFHKTYIDNGIGYMKLRSINHKILEDFYNNLKTSSGLSDRTIKDIQGTLKSIFNIAIKWGYIAINPHQTIDTIKVKKKPMNYYNNEETHQLIECIKDEPAKVRAVLLLAIDSGCRLGELTGLTWNDIDFNNRKITINKVTQYVNGRGIIEKETKTVTSNRTITITEETIKALKDYKIQQSLDKLKCGSKWGNSKRVFTSEFGTDMHPNTPRKILNRVIEKNNLKKVKFHGLRHTSISLQLNNGVPLQVASRRAGHSSVVVTDKIYSHIFEETEETCANVIQNIFDGVASR